MLFFLRYLVSLFAAGCFVLAELMISSGSAQIYDPELRCLIPRFDGAIFSLEWKEALWDKYFTAAPRPRTPSEQQYSDPLADRVMRSMIPRSASYNRGAEPRTRHQCQNSRQVA